VASSAAAIDIVADVHHPDVRSAGWDALADRSVRSS